MQREDFLPMELSINDNSPDLLSEIFSHIAYPGDLIRIGQVCHQWREILKYNTYQLLNRFIMRSIKSVIRSEQDYFRFLKYLYLWCPYCSYKINNVGCILSDEECCPQCWFQENSVKDILVNSQKCGDIKYSFGMTYVFSKGSIMGNLFYRHKKAVHPDSNDHGCFISTQQYNEQLSVLLSRKEYEVKEICECCNCILNCKKRPSNYYQELSLRENKEKTKNPKEKRSQNLTGKNPRRTPEKTPGKIFGKTLGRTQKRTLCHICKRNEGYIIHAGHYDKKEMYCANCYNRSFP